jgi:DNA invertase Pin-like site-specific DNA recombinase
MRAVVYARYSSDLQSEASITDQIEVCQSWLRESGQTDKWPFCLTAAMIAAHQERS